MDRNTLYSVLYRQQESFFEPKNLVSRDAVSKVLALLKLKLPVVITGIRRCGKSSLMVLVRDELKLYKKNCIFVDFSDERLIDFDHNDFEKIESYLVENNYAKEVFFFIDEVQEVMHWEKWVNRLKEKHQILITGSNSKLLSKEIASTLTGRSTSLNLQPFGFKEFLFAKNTNLDNYLLDSKKQALIRRLFVEYSKNGGFPKMILSNDETILRELYENILYRDVVARLGKTLERPVKELSANFLANPSSAVSSRRASELTGVKNLLTIKKVLSEFENSFLYIFISKFDYSIRKQIQNPRKVYCSDNGFLTRLGFAFSDNEGKLLENIVAIELKRRLKETYYFSDSKECDFVIREGNKIVAAIQVTTKLSGENEERELLGLLGAMSAFNLNEGLILTNDQEEERQIENKKIILFPVWKWLLEKQ
ncbi:MAG: ATP-binding protein [archaeon]